jgi:positive regulator of sigma E activity
MTAVFLPLLSPLWFVGATLVCCVGLMCAAVLGWLASAIGRRKFAWALVIAVCLAGGFVMAAGIEPTTVYDCTYTWWVWECW